MSTNFRSVDSSFERAKATLRRGGPVLIHDDTSRENETDIVYPAKSVTPQAVARMRTDGGGLICVALAHEVAEAFELPYLHDALDHPAVIADDLEYDERSSFSLPVNHRETYTGITDEDRATTIRALGEAAGDPHGTDFSAEFRSPGHVHLLKAAPNLLEDRQGHTELGVQLAVAAGLEPAVVVCEMVDDRTHSARSRNAAREYALDEGIPFLEGGALINQLLGSNPPTRARRIGWANHNK